MKKPGRIIVVGGNAAGPAAAAKAKRVNPAADVILFEAGNYISTGTCEMPYVLSGEISDYEKIVFFSPNSFQEERGVKVFVKHFVEEIDTRAKNIKVRDLSADELKIYNYDNLILTTGSKAISLPQYNTDYENVFNFKSVSELAALDDYIRKNKIKKAVLIGSGYIGLEIAESLAKRNIDVTIIEKEAIPLPTAELEFSEQILNILKAKNIKFLGGVSETEPILAGDKIIGIKFEEQYIETELVIVSVGFIPENLLAQKTKLELGIKGSIKVDNKLKTSSSFIYAAGDNIEILNAVTGKPDYIPLATHAYITGHIAGENAAGSNVRCESFVRNISVKIFDRFLASVGLSSNEAKWYGYDFESVSAKARNIVAVMPGSEVVYGKLIYDKNNLNILGASFWGDKEVSGYADLISSLIKTKQPADVLAKINYNYTPPLSPFINLLSIIGKQVKRY